MTVTAATGTVQPGHPAQYTIDVHPTGGAANDVTVQVSVSPGDFPAPAFTVCGAGDGTQTCTLGAMRANQKVELQAQDAVPSGASSGDSVKLTAKVTGVASGATTQGWVSGIASVQVVAPPSTSPTPTPTPKPSGHDHGHGHKHSGHSGHHSDGSGSNSGSDSGSGLGNGLGSGFGPGTSSASYLSPLSGLSGSGSGADPSSLFPTISPSSAPGTGSSTPAASGGKRAPYHPTSVADVLPLNSGQVGSQVAGLVALALGIIIAVVRVSMRKPRTQDKQ